MFKVLDEKLCCGCAACSIICPIKCISMELGTLGALYPRVDQKKCSNCGKCKEVCPIKKNDLTSPKYEQIAYVAYSNNIDIRLRGSSGGMFQTFAENMMGQGYEVYGAAFDENLTLKCTCANTKEGIFPLTKSKYIQSNLSEKYEEIESKLRNGKGILFVSTPCQIAAIKSFLGKDYDSLVTVDFFCHGVPSQHFFNQCKEYDERKHSYKIIKFEFRSKVKNGSTPHYFTVDYERFGKKYKRTDFYFGSTFYTAFQKYICLRESCYMCFYAGQYRLSDITIGDFHEINRYYKKINRFDGVSLIIINSEKGTDIWKSCMEKLVVFPINLKQLINDGICFSGGTIKPVNRDAFVKCYETKPFFELVEEYLNPKSYRKLKLYYLMPSFVRNILKKVIIGE